jgi:UDP-glucose 4-epimerase
MFIDSKGAPVFYALESDERLLARQYVPKNATVLELGARYGTVSCVLSEVLDDPTRHVAVEPDASVIEALQKNREANGGKFHIFNGVVSSEKYDIYMYDKPYEHKEYLTYSRKSETSSIQNMSLKELQNKYNLVFDCIVADCEGFLCDLIEENPWILEQINTLIYEKDGSPWLEFLPKWRKLENILIQHGFKRICSIKHPAPHEETNPDFNNVWKKTPVRVFVTGANGFIGSCLVEKMTTLGYEVIKHVRGESIEKAMQGCDFVVHLGALVEKTGECTPPEEYVKDNIVGSLDVFQACVQNNVKKIINMSSAAVYRDGSENVHEDENIDPKSFYGISKYSTELYLRLIKELVHVNIRSPLVFGPGDNSNRVLNKFSERCMANKPIILFKDGDKQILDYVHVSDVCDFILYCLNNSDCNNKTFNISAGEPTTVQQLAQLLKAQVIIEDVKPGETSQNIPGLIRTKNEVKGCSLSIDYVLKQTGWRPKFSLTNIVDNALVPR